MTLPANKLSNVRRRVNRARRFPDNTCPASRHLHIIAEQLAAGKRCYWFEEENEREHVAGTMLSVLESLWKARTKLAEFAPPPTALSEADKESSQ